MGFSIPLTVFLLSILVEGLIFLLLRKHRQTVRSISLGNVLLITFSASTISIMRPNLFGAVFLLLNLLRLVNTARVAVYRMHRQELYAKYGRTFTFSSVLTFLTLYLVLKEPSLSGLAVLSTLSLLLSLLIFITLIYSLIKWRYKANEISSSLDISPTVSVCIPARNETQDLPGCIESVIASTYRKLEILVLDDCSHDKTPAIIKEYAHDGVRFLKGEEPDESWMPKNKAMNRLFDEATGEIVVFAGVDVRFEQDTIGKLVQSLNDDTEMVSVLPQRSNGHESSLFIQPLRYWWELCVPRFYTSRPPVLSTVWAIKAKTLRNLGQFEAFKKSVQPEAHFAKRLKSKYRFIIAGKKFGVTSVKQPQEQLNTALRTRYPQTKRRPEVMFTLLLLEILLFIVPLVSVAHGLSTDNHGLVYLGLVTLLITGSTNTLVSRLVVYKWWPLTALNTLPLAVLDMYLLIRSMLAYEFSVVRWKERNICLPMLQVEKELPKL
jgi:glycosyltransferase involved in cell wall biosynthesis